MATVGLRETTRETSTDHRPLRVLLFDHTAQLGGGEIALLDLVCHLDPARVTPIVVLASEGPLAERLRAHVEVHVLPLGADVLKARKDELGVLSLLRVEGALRMLRYSFDLAAFARRNKIDLIHTNSLKADILGGIAGWLTGRPVVWHVRDRIEEDYLPKAVVRVFRILCRIFPDYVIGNSDATVRTLHLSRRTPSTAIASGVDVSGYTAGREAARPGANRKHQRIGLIGRLCPWKGQHIFLRAAAEVTRRFPEARFQIIGAALFGEESYEAELHRLCAGLGLDSVVEFTGFRSDVKQLMLDLDIVVHASITGEPFGQVIVQGMAAGKPVVATNGGGVPEIVVDGETGILVPMGDATAMADAIGSILAAPELGKQMGQRGRQRVIDSFTIEQTACKVQRVYAQLTVKANTTSEAL